MTLPFRSVEMEREFCRLPFYHLHTAGVFPFRVGQLCTSVLIANVTLQYATPMPVDREVQKNLWKAKVSKLSVRSPLPLLRCCSSTYQAICHWILLRVVVSLVASCLTVPETV